MVNIERTIRRAIIALTVATAAEGAVELYYRNTSEPTRIPNTPITSRTPTHGEVIYGLQKFRLLEKPQPVEDERIFDLIDTFSFWDGTESSEGYNWNPDEVRQARVTTYQFLKRASQTRLVPFELYEIRLQDMNIMRSYGNFAYPGDLFTEIKDIPAIPHELTHHLGYWSTKGLNESVAEKGLTIAGNKYVKKERFTVCKNGENFDYNEGLTSIDELEKALPNLWDVLIVEYWNYQIEEHINPIYTKPHNWDDMVNRLNAHYRKQSNNPHLDVKALLTSKPSLLCP